jgi:hypothetical protein
MVALTSKSTIHLRLEFTMGCSYATYFFWLDWVVARLTFQLSILGSPENFVRLKAPSDPTPKMESFPHTNKQEAGDSVRRNPRHVNFAQYI